MGTQDSCLKTRSVVEEEEEMPPELELTFETLLRLFCNDKRTQHDLTSALAYPPIRSFLKSAHEEWDNVIGAMIEEAQGGHVEGLHEVDFHVCNYLAVPP